jgi:hypothetical protein
MVLLLMRVNRKEVRRIRGFMETTAKNANIRLKKMWDEVKASKD